MAGHRKGGRKPTSNIIKFKTGNPGRRKLKQEPIPPEGEIPTAPVHLDAYGVEEWNRVVNGLCAMGVLNRIDQQTLAAYCGAYSRWRHAEEELKKLAAGKGGDIAALVQKTTSGNWIQQPLIGIANKAAGDMVKYAAEFGLTPSARARLAVDPGKGKESKYDKLLQGRKGAK
ncbi:MAG TPA: phage terminase small subunit P27 family [Dissulfurispiraceae bacterium]|nr:phage terminase small subunit P27 family [Dissulfurispiraceae bacterium]